jgi:hypothetical protein
MKFNESWFHVAFQDMIYTEMRKWNEWNAIKEYVMDHIWRIAFEYWLDASLFTFNVAIIKDEVVLKLQQYWQVIHLFKVPFWKRFPQYTDYYHDQNFSEELKMYLSVVIDDYRSKTDRETLELNALWILWDKMSEYVQLHNENWKYSHFKSSISKYNSEIKIDFIFLKSDNSINYQTELIIHL